MLNETQPKVQPENKLKKIDENFNFHNKNQTLKIDFTPVECYTDAAQTR